MNNLVEVIETGVEVVGTEKIFASRQLQAQTKAIEKLMNATKRNLYEISARLLIIKNEELYVADGYKDVFEYASQVLGYKKQMVYKMVQVAQALVIETGKKEYHSIFYKDGDREDYTVSQLMEMTTLENEQLEDLNDCNVISPDMTTKEIRTAIKEYKDELKGDNQSEKEVDDTEVSGSDNNSPVCVDDDDPTDTIEFRFGTEIQAITTALQNLVEMSEDLELDQSALKKFSEDLDFYNKLATR